MGYFSVINVLLCETDYDDVAAAGATKLLEN